MRSGYILIVLLFTYSKLSSQNTIGLPDIVNYKKQVYNAGTQTWDIKQDRNGILYFANNEGLLSFDGTYWKLYPLPNKTIVRSLEIGSDNRIYVGGQDEIGFFSPNKNGRLIYSSLKHLIPDEHRSITDVWDIVRVENEIFFRTSFKIFQLNNNTINVFPAENKWAFIGLNNKAIIAQDSENGLFRFHKGSWLPLLTNKLQPEDLQITAITPFGQDSTLVATNRTGILLLHKGSLSNFHLIGLNAASNRFTSLINFHNGTIALGTATGCYIINKEGKVVQSFSKKTGLQNETINTLFRDKNNNIWLGLETGIDFIAFSNAVKHINPSGLNDKAGYAAIIYKNNLFTATTNGLYKIPVPSLNDLSYIEDEFELVKNTEGQTYGLSIINDNLLLGGHEGLFHIKDNTAVPIIKGTGFWTFQPLQQETAQPPLVVAGHYNGLQLLQVNSNILKPGEQIDDFHESARFVTVDKNKMIWTSHPYRGVYRIEFTNPKHSQVKLYTSKNGLPSTFNNHVYKVKNRIVIGTEKGIYEYNGKRDVFEKSNFFEFIFKTTSVRYLSEDPDGNIWFISEKNLGVVDFSGAKPRIIYIPELKGKMVSGFEHIYPINEKNILIGAEEGFYHINYEQYKKNNHNINVTIRTVLASGKSDSLLYGGYFGEVNESIAQPKKNIPQVNHQWNSLHIEFSSPFYEQQANIEYCYYLEGFDKNWSEWLKKTEKDYTNLPAGRYTFQVKARNNLGNESPPSKFTFVVLPPWYFTPFAYVLYLVLFLLACYLTYRWQQKRFLAQQRKHEEEQKRLQYLHQLELEKSEKEIVKLKNEKLETEIDFKNSELASTAMHLVQKGELLVKIKDELVRLNKDSKNKEPLENLKKIIRILSDEEKINEDWQHFAVHFDKVHSDFLVLLKEKYKNLSAHELKLCAYLRMNLSSKEIAQLMNISVRGVEISRYRLRKKLQIPTEVNLFQFLLSLHTSKETVLEKTIEGQAINQV